MAKTKSETPGRDRRGTEQAIIEAAKQVLAEEGFSAFGVNVIARRAGCDKQLIYRYFGGIEGLVEAIGKELSGLYAELLAEPDPLSCDSYAAFVEHFLLALIDALRSSDLLLRIAAWEVLDPSPMTRTLAEARGQALGEWIRQRRGALAVPEHIDTGALNATLIAAVQHLALSARAVGSFGGVRLDSEEDWERIRRCISSLVRAAYGGTADAQSKPAR